MRKRILTIVITCFVAILGLIGSFLAGMYCAIYVDYRESWKAAFDELTKSDGPIQRVSYNNNMDKEDRQAIVVELVDTADLKSAGLNRQGSSPFDGTN